MAERSGIFDMIGPIMIGPSSSHTAGVVRIGLVAHALMGGVPDSVQITFYNSFAATYEGHGSDRAILAGLLGWATDDTRLKTARELATEHGLDYTFRSVGNASTMHPNTVKVVMKRGDKSREVVGQSLGGGVINISEVDGFVANFNSMQPTLVIFADDVKGTIAFLSEILNHDDCNIATMSCSRKAKNDIACQVYAMDSEARPLTLQYISSLPWVKELIYLPPIG